MAFRESTSAKASFASALAAAESFAYKIRLNGVPIFGCENWNRCCAKTFVQQHRSRKKTNRYKRMVFDRFRIKCKTIGSIVAQAEFPFHKKADPFSFCTNAGSSPLFLYISLL